MGKDNWIEELDISELTLPNPLKIAVIRSLWNDRITSALLADCLSVLQQAKIASDDIYQLEVPGSYELVAAARMMLDHEKVDVIIALGCVVKGDTDHDVYINQSVSMCLNQLSISSGVPCILGVLTTNTEEQALQRVDGTIESKGKTAALSALKMLDIKMKLANKHKHRIGFYNQKN